MMASQKNSTKYIKKKKLILILKLLQKTEKNGTLPNWFYEATITLITKPEKTLQKKKIIC